ncbi:hypothetical protein KHS38_09525 [Mucilaginibacter sp. Bleaf8]|uniref:DUF6252 family protein n=1 Tax=Mucilaginibacter sp. Bleaf8 TaxID=2834430 RepID=UPI001BCB6274|nr:DUF6252 family protein [Mucilaginibacter sp. Bleaf8]MBS7564646.1 hypothetical protein [Mucilaginibacter sp. Bleaf8]
MKHLQLLILFIAGAVALQSCKKSADSSTDNSAPATSAMFQATINGTVWKPDTTAATITFNAAAKTKVLTLTGTKAQKRVTVAITLTNATNDNSFTTGTYNVNATTNVNMAYYTQQKDATGNYVFVQHGTVEAGSGTLTLSSIDIAAKTITGSFSFTSTKKTLANNGDVISIDVANITAGQFNAMPYTYTSN